MVNQIPKYTCLPLAVLIVMTFLLCFFFPIGIEEAEDRLMGSVDGLQCLTMTAENPPPGDLIPAPLVTCKLCLCEQSLDKMTILQECQCIFCTPVSSPQCLYSGTKLVYGLRNRESAGKGGCLLSEAAESPGKKSCSPHFTANVKIKHLA